MALAVFLIVATTASVAAGFTVAFIPLDERPTTRWNTLNLARVTPFTVLTPTGDAIPSYKTPANLTALDEWMSTAIPAADAVVAS